LTSKLGIIEKISLIFLDKTGFLYGCSEERTESNLRK
jgi:hypothetical protein